MKISALPSVDSWQASLVAKAECGIRNPCGLYSLSVVYRSVATQTPTFTPRSWSKPRKTTPTGARDVWARQGYLFDPMDDGWVMVMGLG